MTITIEGTDSTNDSVYQLFNEKKIISKISLVDLAGSERLSRTGGQGISEIETQNINRSVNKSNNRLVKCVR